jgi:hypothetical protein
VVKEWVYSGSFENKFFQKKERGNCEYREKKMIEIPFRHSLSMGGPLIFFTRSITAVFLTSAVILVVLWVKFFRRIPKEILKDK